MKDKRFVARGTIRLCAACVRAHEFNYLQQSVGILHISIAFRWNTASHISKIKNSITDVFLWKPIFFLWLPFCNIDWQIESKFYCNGSKSDDVHFSDLYSHNTIDNRIMRIKIRKMYVIGFTSIAIKLGFNLPVNITKRKP